MVASLVADYEGKRAYTSQDGRRLIRVEHSYWWRRT